MSNTIGTAYIQIEPSTKGIAGSISKAIDGEASSAGASAGGKLSSALGTAAKVGVSAIAGVSAALVGVGKASVDAGATFDSSMSQVAATMGFSVDEINTAGTEASETFKKLRDFAQQMGSTTAFSASESAEALNYMALAGYDADTAIETLPSVLNLAAAGGIGLADASDMVTDALSAFGLKSDYASTMVDQMALTASKSNTSVAQLGEAYLTVGANAKNLSGGTQELSMMLGVLADNGIKGSEAGTHLRNIMLAMNPTTDAAAKAWEALGVSGYDAEGKLRPLQDTFKDLEKAMAGMSDQEKTNMLTSMFNKTDLASINALLGTEATRFTELSAAIGQAKGSAEDMAGVQLDNLTGDITLFQSALEGAQIAISDKLTPYLREFVSFGSEGLSQLTQAFNENGFSGALSALGTLLSDGLAMIIEKAPEVINAATQLISAFGQGLLDNLPMIMENAVQIVLQLATSIGESLPTLLPTIVETMNTIADGLIDNIDLIIDAALEIIIGLSVGLAEASPKLIEKGPEIIQKIVEGIIRNLPKISFAAVEVILALGNGLIKSAPQLMLRGPIMISAIVKGIIAGIKDIMEAGADIVDGLWEGIKSQWEQLKQNVSNLASNLVDTVKNMFKIGSPSKVFRDEVGQWIPAGISVGIEENTDVLDNSMKTLQSSLLPDQLETTSKYSLNYDNESAQRNDSIFALLSEYLPQLANMQMVMDSGSMVGALAPKMDKELGILSTRSGRFA